MWLAGESEALVESESRGVVGLGVDEGPAGALPAHPPKRIQSENPAQAALLVIGMNSESL